MEPNVNNEFWIGDSLLSKLSSKRIYKFVQDLTYGNDVHTPKASKYLENNDWQGTYKRIFSTTTPTRTQEFQYKFSKWYINQQLLVAAMVN